MRKTYLFLDFDGVVCDSVPECFLSSHIAYNEFLGRPVTAVPLETKKRFYEYRPFMRSGEDYFLLQKFIEEGKTISVQEDFDRVIRALPPGTMETYKKLFYKYREKVLREDRDYWLSLNPLFPDMKDLLAGLAPKQSVYILSTKKAEFIDEILRHSGVSWPSQRTLYTGNRTKREIIESYLQADPESTALFVDDQLDHLLLAVQNPLIRGFLASWGYVKQEWLEQKQVEVLGREALVPLARNF